jgi:hypothetical protein
MFATAERTDAIVDPFLSAPMGGLAVSPAQAIACTYQHAMDAYWRGESDLRSLDMLLGRFRVLDLPPIPACAPDAFSARGAGGRGISWYEAGDEVVGYVPGTSTGYRIPLSAIPPFLFGF